MIFPPRLPSSPFGRRQPRAVDSGAQPRADDASRPVHPARFRLSLIVLLLGTQIGSTAGAALASTAVPGDHGGARVFGIALIAVSLACALLVTLRLTASIRRLHDDATLDTLTGLSNRADLIRRLDARLDEARRDGPPTTVLVALDLDGFKPINDRFGHAAGDAVLEKVASRLRRLLRRDDPAGRIGGDEFLFAIDVAPDEDPLVIVQRIRAALVARPVRIGSVRLRIGVTAGFARALPGESVEALIERADLALVGGKVRGKNRCYAAPDVCRVVRPDPTPPSGAAAESAARCELEMPAGPAWQEPSRAARGSAIAVPSVSGATVRRGFGELP